MRAKIYALLYPLARWYWSLVAPNTRAAIVVIECEGKWLMIRNTYGSAHWNFPGGRIKSKETALQAASREIKEEVGLDLKELTDLGEIYSGPSEAKRARVQCFYSQTSSSKLTLNSAEILEAAWFLREALPQPVSPAVPKILSLLQKRN